MIKYEDEPIYGGEAYVRVVYDPNLAGSLTFSVRDLPPGISYDPTTGEFRGAALRSAVSRGGSPITYNATITVSDGTATESAIVPFIILDNTFSVETPGTQVSHPGETVFFAPTLSYTQQNFSGPLMFSYENLPEGLSFHAHSGTVYGTISDNLVTPDDNVRDYTVVLTVTDRIRTTEPMNDTGMDDSDPISYDIVTIAFRWRVETDPYPAYLAAVEEATNTYTAAVREAVEDIGNQWLATVQSAENQAVAAYNEYLDAFENAKQQYETAVCEAWNRYYAAIAEPDAQREAAIASVESTLGYYVAPYLAEYEQAVAQAEQRYQQALHQADEAYQDHIAPYLEARNQAFQYWQEHPEDDEAWQAYVQAEQEYQNAVAEAEANRQAAYAQAESVLDQDLEAAGNAFIEATQSYYDNYYDALRDADEAWTTAFEEASCQRDSSIHEAGEVYLRAEAEGWNRYIARLQEINDRLETRKQQLQGELDERLEEAENNWRAAESAAWQRYQNALAQMLQQPAEGPRAQFVQQPATLGDPRAARPEDRRVPIRETNNIKALELQKLFTAWTDWIYNNHLAIDPQYLPKGVTDWKGWVRLFERNKERIPWAAAYFGLRLGLTDKLEAFLIASGEVGKGTYKLDKVVVQPDSRSVKLKIPGSFLRELKQVLQLSESPSESPDFELRITIEGLEKSEDRQWIQGVLVYKANLRGFISQRDTVAMQRFVVRVNDQGNLEWALGKPVFN